MVTSADIIRAIEATQQAGCSFSANIRASLCGMNVQISPADIAACILDGANLPARLIGLTPEEHAEWIERDGHVQCSARTKAGRQCRKSASGTAVTDPAEWKARQRARIARRMVANERGLLRF